MIYLNGINGHLGGLIAAGLAGAGFPLRRLTSSGPTGGDIFCDLREPDLSFCRDLRPGDFFIFIASYCKHDLCQKNPQTAKAVNVQGSGRLIEALLKRQVKVLFFSSAAVYGSNEEAATETSPLNGDNPYALSKIIIEQGFGGDQNFKALRLSFIMSPQDFLVRYFRACLAQGRPAQIYEGELMSPLASADLLHLVQACLCRWAEAPAVINAAGAETADKLLLARLYRDLVAPDFVFELVSPPLNYLEGRDVRTPVSARTLSSFIGPPMTLAEAVTREYR